ncbi:hypothetical protein K8I61_15355 [bacterium]|nr:hypothetical protein [bacterium]
MATREAVLFVKRAFSAIAVIAVVPVFFVGGIFVLQGDADFRRVLSDEDREVLAAAAWSGFTTAPPERSVPSTSDTEFIIVAFHAGTRADRPFMGAVRAEADLAPLVARLSQELTALWKRKIDVTPEAISVHLARGVSRVWIDSLASAGLTYQTGIHGLLRCDAEHCRALPGPVIHANELRFERAIKNVSGSSAPLIRDFDRGDGLYTFLDEGLVTRAFNEKPLPLYRASTLVENLSSADIIEACKIGGDFLIGMQKENGKWYYEYNAGRDKYDKKDYNLLRHAGTTYAMYQLFGATGEPRYLASADKGLAWLKSVIEADPKDKDRLYVREPRAIKLGGAGLALMAFVEKHGVAKSNGENDRYMAGLARHILLSQNRDGSLASYYGGVPGVKEKNRRSIYYPGEAMLGLIRYYKMLEREGGDARRPEILEAVRCAADYLINERWNMLGLRFNVPPDAWLMLALDELHSVDPRPEYAEYAFAIADGIGADQWIRFLPPRDYAGGYYPVPPAVTPAGSRSEGLTATWRIAQRIGDEKKMKELETIIMRAAKFQIGGMIRPQFAGLYPNPKRALGAFRHSPVRNTTRIDYNQHNISGLLVAAEIVK